MVGRRAHSWRCVGGNADEERNVGGQIGRMRSFKKRVPPFGERLIKDIFSERSMIVSVVQIYPIIVPLTLFAKGKT